MRERQSFSRPLFARAVWPRFMAASMAHGQAAHRQRLLAGLVGRVLELGAGEGLNFAYYPSEVTDLVAVEPETNLRAQAVERAVRSSVPTRVMAGTADLLPVADESVDGAVVSLVLCSVPNPQRALSELARVMRSGGQLRFYEHVRASRPALAAVQHVVEPLWSLLGGGCRLTRLTETAIVTAGFAIERIERFDFAPTLVHRPCAPHILGIARRS